MKTAVTFRTITAVSILASSIPAITILASIIPASNCPDLFLF